MSLERPSLVRRALVVSLAFCASQAALADRIELKNGSVIIGDIVAKEGDTLTVKTDFAGQIPVAWSQVAGIETDGEDKFMLKDRTVIEAEATPGGNGTLALSGQSVSTTAPIPMAEVDYINPPLYITGEGVRVTGRANLGLTMNRGNTDNDQLLYDVESIIRSIKNRFTAGATGETKKEDGIETARNNRVYGKYDHFLTEKWYAYGNADAEEDKFKDLNLRTTIGGGMGYQFFETSERSLSLEGGFTYVNNDYDLAEDEGYGTGRWAVRGGWRRQGGVWPVDEQGGPVATGFAR